MHYFIILRALYCTESMARDLLLRISIEFLLVLHFSEGIFHIDYVSIGCFSSARTFI